MKKKRILIVVDVLNGFLNEGALADKGERRIIPANVKLVKKFLKNGEPVIALGDWHKLSDPELKIYPPHCLENTWEAELIDELKVFGDKIIIFKKNTTNGFDVKKFKKYLETVIEETIELVFIGVCTDICVLQAVLEALKFVKERNLNIRIIVPMDAVDTFNSPDHNRDEKNAKAFRFMEQAGIEVVKTYIRK